MEKLWNEVDWEALGYPDTPDTLDKLAYGTSEEIRKAADDIEARIVTAGQNFQNFEMRVGISKVLVNDAQYLTVKSLIEIMASQETSKEALQHTLSLLPSFLFLNEMKDEGEIFRERAKAIRQELWQNRQLIASFLSSSSMDIRANALSTLMAFGFEHLVEAYHLAASRFEPRLHNYTDDPQS